jgi:hypothetical protein
VIGCFEHPSAEITAISAVFDAIVGAVLAQQHVTRMRGRDEALAGQSCEVIEQVLVALRVELARDVVEEQDRRVAVRAGQDRELRGLPGQHDRAQLALGGVGPGLAALELEHQVVAVGPDLGRVGRESLPGARIAASSARGTPSTSIAGTTRPPSSHHVAGTT